MQNEYAKGIYFKEPREGAPEFVKGKMSIKVNDAIAYLQEYKNAGEEWVSFDLARQKSDPTKWSAKKDNWKPNTQSQPVKPSANTSFENFGAQVEYPTDDIDPSEIPFS